MQQKAHTGPVWSEILIDKFPQSGQIVIAQLGQSLDGQIATATGKSKYINGQAGLEHLHRLRAWADVVLVGVGTVHADDPRLNVRLVEGPDPDRVVIDPKGRVPVEARMFSEGDVRKVLMTAGVTHVKGLPDCVEVVSLGEQGGDIAPGELLDWMARQGWYKVLVEGGATTVTRFLQADCLDYLHLIVAPVLLGEGTPGLRLAPVRDLAAARRFSASTFALGQEQLVVCRF
ncbi:RibD family protein [Orrella marina]|uniref:Riboflavin deaminase n=1 Tax=Orrella marina TaxID=2163011 RepID=A0A2R4XKM3_9BURK|nr:RibD family protein [Orrella marina]AWB34330.1 riboflavin deaminase [Orrella marina]